MLGKDVILLKELFTALIFSLIFNSTNDPPRAPGYLARDYDCCYWYLILNYEAGGKLHVRLEFPETPPFSPSLASFVLPLDFTLSVCEYLTLFSIKSASLILILYNYSDYHFILPADSLRSIEA